MKKSKFYLKKDDFSKSTPIHLGVSRWYHHVTDFAMIDFDTMEEEGRDVFRFYTDKKRKQSTERRAQLAVN